MSEGTIERWKVFLYRHFFCSLAGFCFVDWVRLLASNRFRISPRYWPRAAFVTFCTVGNSIQSWVEEFLYHRRIVETDVLPPIYILGHWRSGTTFLHELMAQDDRLSVPTATEVFFPHTVLTGGPMRLFMGMFLPRTRGVDQVTLDVDAPLEEEFALGAMTGLSPYFGWSFPSMRAVHDRRLALDDPDEAKRWKDAAMYFAQKLTLKRGRRPIVFKSPPNTARVRHIRDAFPTARFIHIRRDPIDVFASTRKLIRMGVDGLRLEWPNGDDVDEQIFDRFRVMYERYRQDTADLAPNQLVEIEYAELVADPVGTLERVYEQLGLPDFAVVRPKVAAYVATKDGYRKNVHASLEPALEERVLAEWPALMDAAVRGEEKLIS